MKGARNYTRTIGATGQDGWGEVLHPHVRLVRGLAVAERLVAFKGERRDRRARGVPRGGTIDQMLHLSPSVHAALLPRVDCGAACECVRRGRPSVELDRGVELAHAHLPRTQWRSQSGPARVCGRCREGPREDDQRNVALHACSILHESAK
jgi:hypothetical protein